jgi:hypothetical protein
MTLAAQSLEEDEVSPLELFFDLVFVFAFSQLSHHLRRPRNLDIRSHAPEGVAMSAWTNDELTRIGTADELELASARPDGTLRARGPSGSCVWATTSMSAP